jgi:hypothetical protein
MFNLKDALTKKISIEQAEADLGCENHEWKALLAQMVDGDELWEFSTSKKSWHALAGSAGIALVREGEIINIVTTRIS